SELEQHQRRPVDNLYQARLNQWQQQWQENNNGVSEEETNLLARYVATCTQHLQSHEAELAAAQKQAAALAAQHNTIEEYRSTLARIHHLHEESVTGDCLPASTMQEGDGD